MKKVIVLIIVFSCTYGLGYSQIIDDVKKGVEDAVDEQTGSELSEEEIAEGLKEALKVGIKKGSKKVSKVDGYFKNPKIKIPFPPDMKKVEKKARSMGMDDQVDKVILKMNRAAEDAAKEAQPIFVDAITAMSIRQAKKILEGADDAATEYLRETTHDRLYDKFRPVIEESLEEVNATKYWDEVITAYNELPLVEDKNPDLADYVTNRALKGLFFMIAKEEEKIRQDPAARVSDILKKVFGN